MVIYRKWFLIDINDKENPRSLFAFVNEGMKPKGKNAFYELNGIRYNVVSKSKWTTEEGAIKRAKEYEFNLKAKLKGMDKLTLLTEGSLIKEQIKENGYWKFQEIYVQNAVEKEPDLMGLVINNEIELEIPNIGDEYTGIIDGRKIALRLTRSMLEILKRQKEKEYLTNGKVVIWIDSNGHRLNQ